jgi:predicted GNAT family N-acyltransferase
LPDKAQPPYRIEALERRHARGGFACGAQALDRYLLQQARQDADKGVAAPFVLVEPASNRVLGYYTLSASVIHANDLPEDLSRKLPRYPQLPVTLLGRLAVDTILKGRRMGQFLLMDALWRSLDAAAQIAAMAVVVDAKDKAAEAFYAHFGFTALQQRPARMFLPMKTVASLFP